MECQATVQIEKEKVTRDKGSSQVNLALASLDSKQNYWGKGVIWAGSCLSGPVKPTNNEIELIWTGIDTRTGLLGHDPGLGHLCHNPKFIGHDDTYCS